MVAKVSDADRLKEIIKNIGDGRHLREKPLVRAIHAIAHHHSQHNAQNVLEWLILVVLILIGGKVWFNYQTSRPLQSKQASTVVVADSNPKNLKIDSLKIEAPFLIDNSPPGAWDFTLISSKTDSTTVAIPSPCSGTVRRVWQQGRDGGLENGQGAGNIVEVMCAGKSYGWLMGHLKTPYVKEGQVVQAFTALGVQGCTGRCQADHVHAQIHTQKDWVRITDRSVTAPIIQTYFQSIKSGRTNAGN